MEKSDMETIQRKIFVIRGIKVMLDYDLAELYGYQEEEKKKRIGF
jgi:hypothetical protein